jgi:hypothetical protein
MSWTVKCSSTSTQRPKMLPNDKIVDGEIIVATRAVDMRRKTRQIWLQSWRNRYDSDYSFHWSSTYDLDKPLSKVVSYTIILLPFERILGCELGSWRIRWSTDHRTSHFFIY